MTLNKLKEILKVIVLVLLILALPNLWWNVRLSLQQLNGSLHGVNRFTTTIADAGEVQKEQLEQNKKSIEATLQLGAVFNGTGRLINNQVIPRTMKTLDSANLAVNDLRATIQSSNSLVMNADRELFGDRGLIRRLTSLTDNVSSTVTKFNITVDTLDNFVKEISVKLKMSVDEVYALIASPDWKEAIQNVNITTKDVSNLVKKVDLTAESIRLAMEKAPSIAASVEKITNTSSKFTKITLIANILATLARAFLP